MKHLKKKTASLTLAANLLFALPAAIAEDVRIRTQFPSPYGVYNQVSSTGSTSLAETSGNVQMANAPTSRVAICHPDIENWGGAPSPEKTFGVREGGVPFEQFLFSGNTAGLTGGCFSSNGGLQSVSGAATRVLALNPFGGNVAIGTTASNYTLMVAGPNANAIGIDNGANTGAIQFVYDGAGTFDHAYAP